MSTELNTKIPYNRYRGDKVMWRFRQLLDDIKEYRFKNESQRVDFSQVTSAELKAMRYLRQIKPNEMSKIIGMNMNDMINCESKGNAIAPKEISEKYVVALKIMPNEHLKLKAILNGETQEYNTNRKIPTHIKRQVFEKCKGMCVKCNNTNELHYHHIKHFSRGGEHSIENLIMLCSTCHIEEHKGETVYNAMQKTFGIQTKEVSK